MIVRHPTGLYRSALPRSPSDRGNVTYTISSTDPPRTNLLFPKLPPGVSARRRRPPTTPLELRRRAMGELVFTTNTTGYRGLALGTRQWEVGQVLEFDDVREFRSLEPAYAGQSNEIQHNSGLLDYDLLGVDGDLAARLGVAGDAKFRELQKKLAAARQQYGELQTRISDNQRMITETRKLLAALSTLSSPDTDIVSLRQRQTQKLQQLNGEQGTLINQANSLARAADAMLSELRALVQIVR